MAMTRRGFLGALATAVVGTCVATKVPTAWLPPPVRRYAAYEYLRREYNIFTNGRGENHPRHMMAGRELYEAYERDLIANERITCVTVTNGVRTLRFKGATLHCVGRGWRVECYV